MTATVVHPVELELAEPVARPRVALACRDAAEHVGRLGDRVGAEEILLAVHEEDAGIRAPRAAARPQVERWIEVLAEPAPFGIRGEPR